MTKGRMEAFSDGVIAILITIMVLDLQIPDGVDPAALFRLWPIFLSYVLSFALLGTYWNNHHHLLQASRVVDGRVLWANLFLLFSLSLVPFATAWMGESVFQPFPTAVYGAVSLMAGLTYFLLVRTLIHAPGQAPTLAAAIGNDWKGQLSPILYLIAIPIALVAPPIAVLIYGTVVSLWIVPDLRIERALRS